MDSLVWVLSIYLVPIGIALVSLVALFLWEDQYVGAAGVPVELQVFQDKAAAVFGDKTVSQFTDPAKVETLIRRFLVRAQADAVSSSSGSGAAALAMMQQTVAFLRQG